MGLFDTGIKRHAELLLSAVQELKELNPGRFKKLRVHLKLRQELLEIAFFIRCSAMVDGETSELLDFAKRLRSALSGYLDDLSWPAFCLMNKPYDELNKTIRNIERSMVPSDLAQGLAQAVASMQKRGLGARRRQTPPSQTPPPPPPARGYYLGV